MAQQEGPGIFTAEPLKRRCSTAFFIIWKFPVSFSRTLCQNQHGKEDDQLKDKYPQAQQRYRRNDQLKVKFKPLPLAADTLVLVIPHWRTQTLAMPSI